MRKILIAAALTLGTALPFAATTAQAAATAHEPEHVDWSFSGVFGTFDRNQLKRGYQVYVEVCSACHSLKHIAFRNLSDPGGPEFSEAEAKAIAAAASIPTRDEAGEPTTRKGTLADYFPYQTTPQDMAGLKSTFGLMPPDLSLVAKGREGGPTYIHALLVGYDEEVPEGITIPDGGNYNPYFPGGVIAMPNPLADGQVDYAEAGVPETADQYSKDVSAFLMWAAEPKLEARHRMGFGVMVFLSILAVLFFLSYRRVWRNVDH
jgi:cytochrome c1